MQLTYVPVEEQSNTALNAADLKILSEKLQEMYEIEQFIERVIQRYEQQ